MFNYNEVIYGQEVFGESSLTISVSENGVSNTAYNGSSFVAPYNGASSSLSWDSVSRELSVVIHKTSAWQLGTILIDVTISDDHLTPIEISPVAGSTDVSRSTLISFTVPRVAV
jgi:hypothetical protein